MPTITRFSPSPTGYLHIGNARTAIANCLYALKTGGDFYLRIDDTDLERCKDEYRQQIITDLEWLGIKWKAQFRQIDRLEIYEKVKQDLLAKGKLYACYETEEELNVKRKTQLSRGVPPIYDRAALKLTNAEKQKLAADGIKPHYRFLLGDEETSWNDKIKGKVRFKSRAFSDPVLIRENGSPTYTFCSVVDDLEYKITDIIRGEDHVTNTAIQIQIFKALGDYVPNFAHLALLKTKQGEISKRHGGHDIKTLKTDGIDHMAINSYLAKIGTSENVTAMIDFAKLAAGFDFDKFNKAAINYDQRDLKKINRKVIALYDYAIIKDKLAEQDTKITENFWNLIRENIDKLVDVKIWQNICFGTEKAKLSNEDREFCKIAAELLPANWGDDAWNKWINDITSKTGRKGKELFQPIRLAITNLESGPELKKLILLIGLKNIKERLIG